MALNDYFQNYLLQKKSGSDGYSSGTYDAGTTYQGFLQIQSSSDIVRKETEGQRAKYILFTDVTVPALTGDRVVYNSGVYTVVEESDFNNGISGLLRHKEVIVERFDSGN